MPWWTWILTGILVIIGLLGTARRSWRRMVRGELRAYLEEQIDDIEVVGERAVSLVVRVGDQEGMLNLRNLYGELAAARVKDAEGRKAFYEKYAAMIRETTTTEPLALATHRERILPRLQPEAFFRSLPPEQQPIRQSLAGTDLFVVYVIDSEHSVRYVGRQDATELGIDAGRLHELALDNLRKIFSPDAVRQAVAERSLVLVKAMDSFDAARVLLVPEHLDHGEAVAAVIPDRDTLGLAEVPADGDWRGLAKLARTPAGDHLVLDRPLRVTRDGFEAM